MITWILHRDGCGYDEYSDFLITCETEQRAREIAAREDDDANPLRDYANRETCALGGPWMDPTLSTCVPFEPSDEEGIEMSSFHAG